MSKKGGRTRGAKETKNPDIEDVVSGTGTARPQTGGKKYLRWKREYGDKGNKTGEFVLVTPGSDKLNKRWFSGAELVWGNRNLDLDHPEIVYLPWINLKDLYDTFGYSGTAPGDGEDMAIFIAGKVDDIVANLVKQSVFPEKQGKAAREFVRKYALAREDFEVNAANFTDGKYTGPMKDIYDALMALESDVKATQEIDYGVLAAAFEIGKLRTKEEKALISVLNVNDNKVGTAADKVLKRPINNPFLDKVAKIKDPKFFKAGGKIDISNIHNATGGNVLNPKAKGKKPKRVFLVETIPVPASGGESKPTSKGRFPLEYGIDISKIVDGTEYEGINIKLFPPGSIILSTVKAFDQLVREIKEALGDPEFYFVDDEGEGEADFRDVRADVVAEATGKRKAAAEKKKGKGEKSEKSERSREK